VPKASRDTSPRTLGMKERRLIGKWISDRRRTLSEWVYPKVMPEKQKRVLRSFFGKLTLRYTAKTIYSNLNETMSRFPYRVVAVDSDSAVIVIEDGITLKDKIVHIHFDGSSAYWISLGRNREWFKRIK